MSRLVLHRTVHHTGNGTLINFALAVQGAGDSEPVPLGRHGVAEEVSYLKTRQGGQQLEMALLAALGIAQQCDYLIDEVLIKGWPS